MKEADKHISPQQHQQEPFKKTTDKQDNIIHNQKAQLADPSRVEALHCDAEKKSESERTSKSTDVIHSHDKDDNGTKAKDGQGSRLGSSDSAHRLGVRKEKEDSSKKEHIEKAPAKSREGHTEKRVASQEIPNVTANKENEIKSSTQEQQAASSSSASIDLSPQASALPTSNPQTKTSKPPSKTSSLAKQAAEMLHDIQGLSSPSTPGKKAAVGGSDLSCHNQKESADSPRTPRQKKGKDGEGTPKHLMPNTPDIPSCSPASEAGSENSINMAAHTLMILSRAAITRTGTPLKDSLRQDGFQEKSPTSSKTSKKRKITSPAASPPVKKDRVSTTIVLTIHS